MANLIHGLAWYSAESSRLGLKSPRCPSSNVNDCPSYYDSISLLCRSMLRAMQEVLFIKPAKAKVLPFSEVDDAPLGKRISRHPLHETYAEHTRQHPPK